jgi:hypothetical protein
MVIMPGDKLSYLIMRAFPLPVGALPFAVGVAIAAHCR